MTSDRRPRTAASVEIVADPEALEKRLVGESGPCTRNLARLAVGRDRRGARLMLDIAGFRAERKSCRHHARPSPRALRSRPSSSYAMNHRSAMTSSPSVGLPENPDGGEAGGRVPGGRPSFERTLRRQSVTSSARLFKTSRNTRMLERRRAQARGLLVRATWNVSGRVIVNSPRSPRLHAPQKGGARSGRWLRSGLPGIVIMSLHSPRGARARTSNEKRSEGLGLNNVTVHPGACRTARQGKADVVAACVAGQSKLVRASSSSPGGSLVASRSRRAPIGWTRASAGYAVTTCTC